MSQIGVNVGSYAFVPGGAGIGTITFSGVTISDIEQIKPIVNGNADTVNSVIFNPAETGKFGVLVGNVLTLDFDTSSMASTDKLYICANIPIPDEETVQGEILDTLSIMNIMLKTLSDISEKQDETNKWLRKIYSPE